MKIKAKLTLGIGALFTFIFLLTVLSTWYINKLESDTQNILTANHNSMAYARNMLTSLEEPDSAGLQKFNENLQKQEANCTEIGEKETTERLRKDFKAFAVEQSDKKLLSSVRNSIYAIMEMNMDAIHRKSEVAKNTAENAKFWIAVTGALCFMASLVLLLNLPSNIANPIKKLTESIKQIAAQNYSERVHVESHNEFGTLARSFNTMAEKLQEYNNSSLAELMMEKKRIETLINNMHDPVIGLDEQLKVLFVNEEAAKVLALPATELIGVSALELALRNDLMRTLIRDATPGEGVKESNTQALKIYFDSKESYFEKEMFAIEITPTGEQAKQLIGHVIILRNVTPYKELDFAKTNFIATVSHEFKTPISSIEMSTQLLSNKQIGTLNPEQQHLVEGIKEETSRLLKITSELLNMTQVESGNIQLSIIPSDAVEIIQDAIAATKTQLEQAGIKLEMDIPAQVPKVLADAQKTTWVLINLISNAVRYSPENSVINVSLAVNKEQVMFAVKDTGKGIAPQFKDKIFDRYFRIPGTKKEGTGLGLAISKEFIEAQGGKITVESELGKGSEFMVVLNVAG